MRDELLEKRRREYDAFWKRVRAVQETLKNISLSRFTAEDLPYLNEVMGMEPHEDSRHHLTSQKALEYLEKKTSILKKNGVVR